MPTMENVNFNSLYVLQKGEPGTRKSTQALSFPKPQYWFSWDRKMSSIYLPMQKWGIDPKLVSYDNYEDWSRAQQKMDLFKRDCPFRTLVFDSITSMGDATLRQVNRVKYGVRKSGQPSGKQIAGISVSELEDYNAESSALMDLVLGALELRNLHRVNIILIAHVIQAEYRSTTNNTTHISRSIVTASKKTAFKIPAYCGEIYHFNMKRDINGKGEYSLLTEHSGDDFAKTELGLDREIVFGDAPIYDTYLKPAIDRLAVPQSTVPSTVPQSNW